MAESTTLREGADTAESPTPGEAAEPTTLREGAESPAPDAGSVPHAGDVGDAPRAGDAGSAHVTSDDAAAEPQNALTRKFTDAEWDALRELRAELPRVFAEAFPGKEGAETTAIKLWGVTLDPRGAVGDARGSVVLMKFLRARNLSVREARSMLVSTLQWRESFKPEEAMEEEFPAEVFGGLGHVYGRDKGERPVTYNLYGANQDLKAVFGDTARFLRWRVGLMEKGVALLDFVNTDQMLQVHDYEGVRMSSRDANSKAAAAEATRIFTAHYPELLYRKFFVNVPTVMTWIFWAFRPLLPAQTVGKMHVVGSGADTIGKTLLGYVGAGELPERYGGTAKAF